MKDLLYDMAQIYQRKALNSLDAVDLAHAKRYREAADVLEAKDASIEHYKSGLESAIGDIAKLKALCDQLGNALEAETKYQRNRGGDVVEWVDAALTAWRASK